MKHLLVPRNNEAELAAFDAVCTRLSGFDPALFYEWIDGYLTALAAGPRLPEPQAWQQALWGETFDRVFADPADRTQALAAVQRRLHVLCKQLAPEALYDDVETLRLEPLMEEWDDATRQALVANAVMTAEDAAKLQTGTQWSAAFFSVLEAFPQLWVPPIGLEALAAFDLALLHVAMLMEPPDSAEMAAHLQEFYPPLADKATPTRDDLIAEALWSVQDLRMLAVDALAPTATIHVDSKPGRNEPCHCGSGKKFKKCHGA
jgi:uncharacterized protein